IQGLLEPAAIGQYVKYVEQQGGRRGYPGKSGPTLPIGIAGPDPYGIFRGGPNGPGVLEAETGPCFPGNGPGGIKESPILVPLGPVHLVHGQKRTVNGPCSYKGSIEAFLPKGHVSFQKIAGSGVFPVVVRT